MPAVSALRILVVDDQQSMRGLARQCLKRLGVLDVALAASAEQALEAMAQQKFDAVISDLNMPGMTGVELAQRIKAHPVLKGTPVFVATSESYRDRASDEAVDHFVAKPFSLNDMRDALEEHLGILS